MSGRRRLKQYSTKSGDDSDAGIGSPYRRLPGPIEKPSLSRKSSVSRWTPVKGWIIGQTLLDQVAGNGTHNATSAPPGSAIVTAVPAGPSVLS